jgi:predicted signal transduction protein with EAL and GGDEF domain
MFNGRALRVKDVILTDIDGCLIQWQSGLPYFLAKHSLNTEKAQNAAPDDTAMVLRTDMDGLKAINDTFGHAE